MSSLLQFNGNVTRRGVELETILTRKDGWKTVDVEPLVDCDVCGKQHSQIHVFVRRPRGMFGCWVVFRYNGEDHVPDLSCPFNVEKLPRDAKRLEEGENSRRWHREH